METLDIAVVGAGAAGLMAAIFAGREATRSGRPLRVVALDGAARIGAKILIAGGGRCNITNETVTGRDFNGGTPNAIAKVLRTFGVAPTLRFFEEIGVGTKREEHGKIFPVTDRAQSVLDALLAAVCASGSEVRTGSRVSAITPRPGGFDLTVGPEALFARSVVLATGGRSVPKTGSDGAGYSMARGLGHSIVDPFPALVPLVVPREHWTTSLRGVSADVELRLEEPSGRVLKRVSGSMLFTHFGISGPAGLDMSRHWIEARRRSVAVRLVASFLPGLSFDEVEATILDAARINPRITVGSLLRRWLTERLAATLAREAAAVAADEMLVRLTRERRRDLVRALTALEVPVTGDRGYQYAEVTAGGVPLGEIDLATMQSRVRERLWLCGEILDVDGRIGGFNFQWAWASGRLAGISAAKALLASK